MKIHLILVTIILTIIQLNAQQTDNDPDTAYTRVLIGRVNKFLPEIINQKENGDQYIRVRDIIVQQYKDLSKIHDTRDERVAAIRSMEGIDKTIINRKVDSVKSNSTVHLYKIHAAYLGRLSSELTPEQVNMVKDGMTYGVLQHTYKGYLDMIPDLTDEQKRQIMSWLVEARDLAMDKGSSKKKHAIFGKYKGKINNYLSGCGYDLKKASKEWEEKVRKEKEKN